MPGRFLYVDKVLGHYRVHDGATSKEFIVDHRREREDRSMFEKFWPKWIASWCFINLHTEHMDSEVRSDTHKACGYGKTI